MASKHFADRFIASARQLNNPLCVGVDPHLDLIPDEFGVRLDQPNSDRYREGFVKIGMFENAVYPGIPEGFAALARAGWRLFVVTSKPTAFARPILERFDLVHHFAGIYGSELSGERSDKGDLISYVLESEHIPAEQAAMIGYRSHDVIGAKSNKMRSFGVLWGYGTFQELVTA